MSLFSAISTRSRPGVARFSGYLGSQMKIKGAVMFSAVAKFFAKMTQPIPNWTEYLHQDLND